MILPDVSYGELKTFVESLGYSIPQPRKLVTEEEEDCDYTVAAPSPFSEAELDIQR